MFNWHSQKKKERKKSSFYVFVFTSDVSQLNYVLFCVIKGIFYGKYKFQDQGWWFHDWCIFTLFLDTVTLLKLKVKNKLAEPFVALYKPIKKAMGVFLPAVMKSIKREQLYIFHITCCKVLICEALIKTLVNDLWIAIPHSAFLLFYTFFMSYNSSY